MRRVLITGGSGFIGTNLVDFYVQQGVEIINLDWSPPRDSGQSHLWRCVNLLDAQALGEAMGEFAPTQIVHLAARTDLDETSDSHAYAANTDGVENLTTALHTVPSVRRVVFASSMLIAKLGYRPHHDEDYCPTTAYGRSKAIGESIVRRMGQVPYIWTLVRPTSIWGPWFGEPYRPFFERVERRRFAFPVGRAATRTFGYVGNTIKQIDALLRADANSVHGRTFYLGDDPPLNIGDWARLVAEAFEVPAPRAVPLPVLWAAAKLGDVLAMGKVRFPMTSFRLRNMTTDHVLDLSAIRSITAASPFDLREGIRQTVRWLKASSHPS